MPILIGQSTTLIFNQRFKVVDEHAMLSWVGKSKLTKTIFVWSLEASDEQTIITVEQSVEGIVIPLLTNHNKLHDILIDWLAALKQQVAT